MNTLESSIITSPFGEMEECAKFVIDEVSIPFALHNITHAGQNYTLGFYVMAESECNMYVANTNIAATPTWQRYTIHFTARSENLLFNFQTAGTYYIYHPKLEIGDKDTDWSKAPEDFNDALTESNEHINESLEDNSEKIRVVETLIAQLKDSIEMLVTDGNGASLMEQTADGGWTFSMGKTEETLRGLSEALDNMNTVIGDTSTTVEILDSAVKDLGTLASYINISELTGDNGTTRPVIELGTLDENGDIGEFRLLITNTDIRFTQGSSVPAYISNKALHITKAVIEEEIQLGGFVIKQRANGNLGFLWKGVTG